MDWINLCDFTDYLIDVGYISIHTRFWNYYWHYYWDDNDHQEYDPEIRALIFVCDVIPEKFFRMKQEYPKNGDEVGQRFFWHRRDTGVLA